MTQPLSPTAQLLLITLISLLLLYTIYTLTNLRITHLITSLNATRSELQVLSHALEEIKESVDRKLVKVERLERAVAVKEDAFMMQVQDWIDLRKGEMGDWREEQVRVLGKVGEWVGRREEVEAEAEALRECVWLDGNARMEHGNGERKVVGIEKNG